MTSSKLTLRMISTIITIMLCFPLLSNAAGNQEKRFVDLTVKTLEKQAPTIDEKVLELGVKAYYNAEKEGLVKNKTLTIVDYSLASTEKRMWVFNLKKDSLSYNTHVAHGVNSGGEKSTHFSNTDGSKESSIGTFITAETYHGKNGLSLKLDGLDKGLNDNARSRYIVIHGAKYADPSVIPSLGRLGRSWGCPAISFNISEGLINEIKDGSVMFSYYPEKDLLRSSYLV